MVKPISIPLSIFRWLKTIGALLFFAAFLVLVPFLANEEKPMGAGIAVAYGFLVSLACLAFLGAARELIYRKNALQLDNNGFTYSVPLFNRRTVLWRDVKNLRQVHLGHNGFIAVALHNENAYFARLNWPQRINAKLLSWIVKAPIAVEIKLLQDSVLVPELMESYRKQATSGDTFQAH